MKIFEDTRNKKGKHQKLHDYLNTIGCEIIRTKLYVGDYARIDNNKRFIDTKKDWMELASNICGKQHARFREECIRAQDAEFQLIVLVEEEIPVREWKAPLKRSGEPVCKVSGEVLEKAMNTMTEKYGVKFLHCSKELTAPILIGLLFQEDEICNMSKLKKQSA